MKTISSWSDLRPYGIDALTGEACGLMYRILFDVTAKGKQIIEKCLSVEVKLAEAWNRGSKEDPHVGSIMLAQEMLTPLAVFALLESGCREVWRLEDSLLGIDPDDTPETVARLRDVYGDRIGGSYRYGGTAGDRNVHQMTGRVQ